MMRYSFSDLARAAILLIAGIGGVLYLSRQHPVPVLGIIGLPLGATWLALVLWLRRLKRHKMLFLVVPGAGFGLMAFACWSMNHDLTDGGFVISALMAVTYGYGAIKHLLAGA